MSHKPMIGFQMRVWRVGLVWRWLLRDTLGTFLDGGLVPDKNQGQGRVAQEI